MSEMGELNPTTSALLGLAKDAGFEVSADQLKRWSRRGLIARSRQQQRPGMQGSETVWPVGTDAQLLAVCRLRGVFGRRHDALLLALWWEQWPVELGALLGCIQRQITQLPLGDRRASEEERLDRIDDLVNSANPQRLRGPIGKVVRRASRDEADRRSLMWAVCAIAHGIEPPIESANVGLDERGIGDLMVDGFPLRPFARQASEVGETVEPEELARNIAGLAGQMEPMLDYAEAVVAAGDIEELDRARDQARSLMNLALMSDALLPIDSDNGLGLIGELVPSDNDPGIWVFTLVWTLWLRHTRPEDLGCVTDALQQHAPAARAFAALLNGVPGFRDAIVEAGGDNDALALIAESRPELRSAISRFLAEHPDIAAALDLSLPTP